MAMKTPTPLAASRYTDSLPDLQAHGHVQPWEEAKAKELVDAEFVKLTGRPFKFITCGYFITLKIYVRSEELLEVTRPDGSKVTLFAPQKSLQSDKYQSCAALVVGIGPAAYTGQHPDGSPKFPTGPWCRIGDWVTIPRYESHLFLYHGIALGQLPDDKIMGVIEDPTDVEPVHQKDEF